MRTTTSFLAAALCALAAACGGKSAPASTGPGNTGGAGDAPSDDAAKLVAQIGAMAVPEPCNNDDGTANLKDHLAAQREALGGEAATDTTFECQPPMDGLRECTWGVYNKPPSEPDPDDPCGGECCSGYQIIFKVDAAGAIDPASVVCIAPG